MSQKSQPTSRSLAVSVVLKVRFGQEAVQAALDTAYSRSSLPFENRGFCTELVYGTLRKFDRLEFFLRAFLERFDSLPKEMGIALCVASYELFYTRVPVYATVDTFVTLIRSQFGPVMGKVANGVLRNLERHREDFFDQNWYTKNCASEIAGLACWHAVPEWLLEVWLKAYGSADTAHYLEASSLPAPNTLRFNSKGSQSRHIHDVDGGHDTDGAYDADGVPYVKGVKGVKDAFAELLPFSQEFLNIQSAVGESKALSDADESHECVGQSESGGAEIKSDPTSSKEAFPHQQDESYLSLVNEVWSSFKESPRLTFTSSLPAAAHDFMSKGLVSQQSGAVLEVLEAMRPQEWSGPIWDCCCGRGGKTLALLEQDIEVALASDISKPRLRGLEQELRRLGLEGACLVENFSAVQDIKKSQFYAETGIGDFGCVVIDAPCSGFGTLARHPEIRFRRTLQDVATLARLQGAILDNTWQFVRRGGDLVYITCTLMPEENEEQVARFLAGHKDMTVVASYQTPAQSRFGEFFYGVRFKKA